MPSDRTIIDGVEHIVKTNPSEPAAPTVHPMAGAADDRPAASVTKPDPTPAAG